MDSNHVAILHFLGALCFVSQERPTPEDGDEDSEVSAENEEDQEGDEPNASPDEAVEEGSEGKGDCAIPLENQDQGCEGDGESSDGGCEDDACLEEGVVNAEAVADEGEVAKPELDACSEDSEDEMPPLGAPAEVDSLVPACDSPPPQKVSCYNEELFRSPEAGNSGFASEIVEMCIALMEWFSKHNPDILKILSQFLTQCVCVLVCHFESTLL